MNRNFNLPEAEVKQLAEEIAFLRRELQTANATLNRMEKRLKVSFPNYPDKSKKRSLSENKERVPSDTSVKNREALMADFEQLVGDVEANGDVSFESFFGEFSDDNTLALAHELGVTYSGSSSIKKAKEGIKKRAQETMLLRPSKGDYPNSD